VGLDQRGAIVLRQKWSRGQVESRFANMPPCLIGMERPRRRGSRLGEDEPVGALMATSMSGLGQNRPSGRHPDTSA
jgi:hypothetical protein